ncbi:MAG: sugar phosphate isomerase/epimerase [Verrucomicrobiae bacterium]|nr:sugar phosphate isomerase/epimerase [Verrucomicrobiae bacterium]
MQLSLAGWSLCRQFIQDRRPLTLLDFPKVARRRFGIAAVELNNVFFADTSAKYLRELNRRAKGEGVTLLNIAVDEAYDMCSRGWLGRRAVNAYAWWISVAAELGCSAIRANSGGGQIKKFSSGDLRACAENFAALAARAKPYRVRIVMENHWGLSSCPERMLKVRRLAGGCFDFLPDFGNWPEGTDKYAALSKIMPFAKAVHAKIKDIAADGSHPAFDLGRCVQVAKASGYDGWLGIEYEGKGDADTGIRRAVRELKKYL